MNKIIEIHWTTSSLDLARKICRYLIQEKLVACAQITPWIESIYLWDGQLETNQESKIVLKTLKDHYDLVKTVILENHNYDIPEITFVSIEGGHQPYLDWINQTVRKKENIQG